MSLSGTHHVRAIKSALHKARRKYWPQTGPRMEVRRQALKLRFWGDRHRDSVGSSVLDLSYEAIKSMPGSGVHELRLDDEIGGHRNIRVIFLDPDNSWVPVFKTPLPTIWVLEAIPKRRNDWTQKDIERFWALRTTVKERFFE